MKPNRFSPTGVQRQPSRITSFLKFSILIFLVALLVFSLWLGKQFPMTTQSESTSFSGTDTATSSATSTEVVTINDTASAPTNTPTTTEPAQNSTPTTQPTVPTQTPVPKPVPNTTPAAPAGPTIITAYITEATLNTISLDNIAIYEGDAAIQRMIADGLCTAAEPQKCRLTNGVYYRNTDPTTRTYPLSPEVEVRTWTGTEYPISRIVNRPSNQTPYSVTISSSGVVTKIQEIYRP